MNKNNIIKLAGAVKPPARKTEIIEALAIRKRDQIIEENKTLRAELESLRLKLQVVAAEEMAANGKRKNDCRFSCYTRKQSDGRIEVDNVTVTYHCEPSAELRKIARRIHDLEHMSLHHTPSLHEVRQQVRASVTNCTPPDGRIKHLLTDPAASQMLDTLLTALDGKKQLTLTA